ncbi:short-chain dehydrogenase [Daldinia caldariorum]|uniref:short-chain dehydrogenase n=1 Tax=Daldinia caldariorum TaxID=326644 RepID=UPI00200729CD|nr:short-chain dehydrogenase [Daldinia caldariorum]KAI1466047.1 short-chain dehydrogenase [Daldinia caldariorum]
MALVSRVPPFQLTARYAERSKWEIVEDKGGYYPAPGPNTVRALASTGATIFGTARNLGDLLSETTPTGRTRRRLTEILCFTGVIERNTRGARSEAGRAKHGFEPQFGTNHTSRTSSRGTCCSPAFRSRVVNVFVVGTSVRPMANRIERLYGAKGLHGHSLNPPLAVVMGNEWVMKYFVRLEQVLRDERARRPSRRSWREREECISRAQRWPAPVPKDGDMAEYGYGEWAFDREKEERLWWVSKKMVGVE